MQGQTAIASPSTIGHADRRWLFDGLGLTVVVIVLAVPDQSCLAGRVIELRESMIDIRPTCGFWLLLSRSPVWDETLFPEPHLKGCCSSQWPSSKPRGCRGLKGG